MKLTKEDGRSVVFEDHKDWETIEEQIIDTSRWSNIYEGVFLHKPTNKHYRTSWSSGATEMQEEMAFEYDDPEFVEVESQEVVVKQWIAVN